MERFARTKLLVGAKGLDSLAHAGVIVIGLGGVGSYTAEALIRSGIGRLRLIDGDVIEVSNINRQLHALNSSVGKAKVEVLAQRFREINPAAVVEAEAKFYAPDKGELLSGGFDWVVDAVDVVSIKADILSRCWLQKQPVISSMGTGNRLDASLLRLTDISETYNCPLARAVRRELRRRGIGGGIPAVWSPEQLRIPPAKPIAGSRPVPGSIAYVPSTAGLLIASYVVNKILQGK